MVIRPFSLWWRGAPLYLLALISGLGVHLRAQGVITTVAGTEWVFAGDGKPALSAPLGHIASITLDRNGALIIADPGNAVVLRVNPDNTVTVIAGNGLQGYSGDGGAAVNASLDSP